MKPKPNYNYGFLEVVPQKFYQQPLSIPKLTKYENDEHLIEMSNAIKRHIDNILEVHILYSKYVCGKCLTSFDTYKEADECCHETYEIPFMEGTSGQLDGLTIRPTPADSEKESK